MNADPVAPPDPDFTALTAKISRDRGFGCASYKEKCLRRRIAVRMRARGIHTFADYARLLDADAAEYDRLIDALTINVTKLFRNWETYAAIERTVIPTLWARPDRRIRVWSAGCSSGEEPYSIAVLFHKHAQRVRDTERLAHVSVLGTDIDRDSLDAAVRAEYDAVAFTDTPDALRRTYFSATAPHAPIPAVRDLVAFERRDLLSEAPPSGPQHLIVCRNVLIYFDRATQEALFERFHLALAPGGFLVLGKVETLLGVARSLFEPVDGRERIFSRT
ncbi:MAG TPA: protein-glutamate O-methyltransferase CheR [Gemmatimonadaceae bacterium]|nr:protein-glutamate O-methyltransferase CheR [Gemmatimonadaceae bacterium]